MLPGPGATQLGIFIGHGVGGIVGGIIAGLCFVLPAFFIMTGLAAAYAAWGAVPTMRSAFYGIGPVVVGVFAVAVYRLARSAVKDKSQLAIAIVAAAITWFSPLGLVSALTIAGCTGIALFDSKRHALRAITVVMTIFAIGWALHAGMAENTAPRLTTASVGYPDMALFFFKVGAFTFGGGLSMLAFMDQQLVNELGWLTRREFLDGLAMSQLTPGPILMLAAFVGFKLHGFAGATVAAVAIFLPSFLMMLLLLPALRRMQDLRWLKAFMRGVAPAIIGALAVSLLQMAPHAAPDWFSLLMMVATIILMLWRNWSPLPMIVTGGFVGIATKNTALLSRLWR